MGNWLRKGMRLCATAAVLWLSATPAMSAPLSLTDSDARLSPYSHLSYFCTSPEASPLINELTQNIKGWPWQAHGPEVPNHGYTSQVCWYRLTVLNQTSEADWTLGLGFPLITLVDAYLTNPEGEVITQYREGGDLPYSLRQTRTLAFAFKLELPSESTRDILLRLDTANLQLPLVLMASDRFAEYQTIITVIHSLFLGGMLVMILYNMLLYVSLRESAWLPYVCWATLITFLQITLLGFGPRFLWPNHPDLSTIAIEVILSGLLIAAPWFVNRFLNLARWTPRLATLLWYHAAAGALMLLAIPFIDRISLMTIQLITLLSLAIAAVSAVIASHDRSPEEKPEVRGFIVAWGCFVVGGFVLILNKLGVLPRTLFTEYLLELGSFLAVALLSRAVAAQINRLKAEKARAEAMSQAKSDFLATMSHEIRTPMNGVLGLADLLRHTPLNTQQEQYVDTIYQSSQVLLTVINDILDYSKIEAGKLHIEQIETSLEQLVGDCLALHAPRVIHKPVRLWCEMDHMVPDSVMTDPLRIKQILNNLLSNACKFTEKGDVILRVCLNESQLKFEVQDSGIGLSLDEQQRIFGSYEQAGTTTTHRYGGTGLGLAISKRLVELMGGAIGVSSHTGLGSCFWFTLPMATAQNSPGENRLHGRTLGILTSDTTLGESLSAWAQRWGMCVITSQTSHSLNSAQLDVLLLGPDHADNHLDLALPSDPQRLIAWPMAAMPLPGRTPVIELPLHPSQLKHMLKTLLKETETPQPAGITPVPVCMTGLKVLIAEDNAVNQLVLTSLLKSIGIEATVVDNGAEAVSRVTSAPSEWDIIFMDTEMPVMDGHSATRNIRSWELATASCPSWIIAISAHATPDRIQEARTAGVSDYLGKPVTRLQVLEALREALRQRTQMIAG